MLSSDMQRTFRSALWTFSSEREKLEKGYVQDTQEPISFVAIAQSLGDIIRVRGLARRTRFNPLPWREAQEKWRKAVPFVLWCKYTHSCFRHLMQSSSYFRKAPARTVGQMEIRHAPVQKTHRFEIWSLKIVWNSVCKDGWTPDDQGRGWILLTFDGGSSCIPHCKGVFRTAAGCLSLSYLSLN